ncbi:unnamed protein product [Amoebophrya sp. A25]|nr:unnamed protein product [Amoebophrya sp. A25]|eukprot:GSA25T00021254001.1
MKWVQGKVTLQRLLKLVNGLPDMTEFHCAAKLLRVLNMSHKIGSKDLELIRQLLPAKDPTNRLDVLFLWQLYLTKLLAMLVPRCRKYEKLQVKLNEEQEILALELLLSFHQIASALPQFSYARYHLVHLQCLNLVFYQFFSPAMEDFVEYCLYDLRLDSLSASGGRISNEFAVSGNRRVAVLDFALELLAQVMMFSPSLKYDILERFNHAPDVARLPYLQQLLHLAQMDLYTASIEILLNYQQETIQLHPTTKERVLHLLEVSYPNVDSPYHKMAPTKDHHERGPPETACKSHLLLCVSTKRILLFQKDTTRAKYWLHPALAKPCGVCPTQAFCPKTPRILWQYPFERLCRIVDGMAQTLALGFMHPMPNGHGFVEKIELLKLKLSAMGKRKVMDNLESLSKCGLAEDAVLGAAEDVIAESGLIFRVGDSQIVTVQVASRLRRTRNLDLPRTGEKLSLQAASEEYGKPWESGLLLLTEGEFFAFKVNWNYWQPPFEEDDEDGAAIQESIRVRLRGRMIPKLAAEVVARGARKGAAAQETGGADVIQGDLDLQKKHAERSRLREKTEFDHLMNATADDEKEKQYKTKQLVDVRAKARRQYILESTTRLSAETPTIVKNSLGMPVVVKEEDVTARDKKKKSIHWCHDQLLRSMFHASLSTLLEVELGTQVDEPSLYLKFTDEVYELVFDHDTSREAFRRALAFVLNQEDVSWLRSVTE